MYLGVSCLTEPCRILETLGFQPSVPMYWVIADLVKGGPGACLKWSMLRLSNVSSSCSLDCVGRF
jgi:hypothetical protein